MRLLLLLLAALCSPLARAQDVASSDSTAATLSASLAASQAHFGNWQQGGLNALAATAGLSGTYERFGPRWEQTYEMNLSLGVVKQDTLAVRKSDDLIRLEAALRYAGDGFFQTFEPTLATTFRSQFAPGFNFDTNPFKNGEPLPVKVSDFLAPGFLTQSVGLTYEGGGWFKQRVGVGLKETVVAIRRLRPLYNLDRDRQMRVEGGLESRTDVNRMLIPNVRYKSSLGLFAAFNRPDMPDLTWDNELFVKSGEWLTTKLEVAVLLDRDVDPGLQVKQVLSLGVLVALL
jgi:hypothetical protein